MELLAHGPARPEICWLLHQTEKTSTFIYRSAGTKSLLGVHMRTSSKAAIANYIIQSSLPTSSSNLNRPRVLREHIKRTRDLLSQEKSEEDFASVLARYQKNHHH
jgi:hypothetical protein